MVETLIAAALLAGGIVAITRNPAPASGVGLRRLPEADSKPDLPCPWCHAQTDERDVRCPSCGQRFG